MRRRSLALIAGALAACEAPDPGGVVAEPDSAPAEAVYLGSQTRLLDDNLVNFLVEMRGATGADDLAAYADCVAAGYAAIRSYGFARHVRTNVAKRSGHWRADAVYTVSPAPPDGLRILDANVVVASCAEDGIPTI